MKNKILILILLSILILTSCSPIRYTANRPVSIYLASRAEPEDFQFLVSNGITHVEARFSQKTGINYEPSWKKILDESKRLGLKIVIWPSDWDHPRANCGHESPFPISTDGNIDRIKRLLDVALPYENVVGIYTVHEALSNCKMTVQEMTGLKTKIKDYAMQTAGRDIEIWNYVGINKLTVYPSIYTETSIPGMMDVLVSYKFCAGRTDYPCSSLPGYAVKDRNRLEVLGLNNRIKYVFLQASYLTTYAPYNVPQTYEQAADLSYKMLLTNAMDGYGWYTFNADWWADMKDMPELLPLIPYVKTLISGGPIPSTTPTDYPTPVPTTTASITPLPPTPTKTPAPPSATPQCRHLEDSVVTVDICLK